MPIFPENWPWRFAVTDLQSETLTLLDNLAMDRQVNVLLGAPWVHSGRVPSDNPQINITHNDFPFLNEGNRMIYGFRREGDPTTKWEIRFAGIIMQVEDRAESNTESVAYTHYTAFDPWQYLMTRPVVNFDGSMPGKNGISFTATAGSTIAAEILRNTILNDGAVHVDAGALYGGTGFYTGTIETTLAIDYNIQQGKSVGEVWQDLMATDTLDVVLIPIYDPINRPGYLVEFNVYSQVGSVQDGAVFSWDKPGRSLVGISHLFDGGQRANNIRFFAGQGGRNGEAVTQTDPVSVARYGKYEYVRFFPGEKNVDAVTSFAEFSLNLRRNGKETVQISPAPERSPIPFLEYFLGDRVPVFASNNLRMPIPAYQVGTEDREQYQRVYGIPIRISDDGVEEVTDMIVSVTQ